MKKKRNNKQMVYCTFQDAPQHQYPGHPESPKRLGSLREWLEKPPFSEIEWLDFQSACEDDITLIHRQHHLAFLKEHSQLGAHEFEPSPSYMTPHSYQAAMDAVGATLAISRRIINEGRGRGFAIVRPPGHHAEPDAPMGFCLLNNIAIAAADAVASGLGSVVILDIDAHHGNGTEAAFWDTPSVGYFSTHEANLYPGSGHMQSAAHARGRIVNVPLPSFTGGTAFMQIFDQIVKPWLDQFQPEMLFVSAGYDTHFSDPLTTLTLDTADYYSLTNKLIELADDYCEGRIMFVLEGGYDPLALKDNIQACLAAMCGNHNFPDHYGPAPAGRSDVSSIIEKIKAYHQLSGG